MLSISCCLFLLCCSHLYPPWTQQLAPKNAWSEYNRFLLGPGLLSVAFVVSFREYKYSYIDLYQVWHPPNMAGCPLENPRDWLPQFPNSASSPTKSSSLRGNLILSRFAGQPMKNLAELARAVRPLKPWKSTFPGDWHWSRGVEWKAFGFFVFF